MDEGAIVSMRLKVPLREQLEHALVNCTYTGGLMIWGLGELYSQLPYRVNIWG